MASADTARLIASLELQDKFTPGVNKAIGSLGRLESKASSTAFQVGQHIGRGINSAVRNIERLGVVAGVFLVSQIKFGIDGLKKLDTVVTQTNAVLASTRGVAGQTADSIRKLAEKYEDLNAVIDDKVIQSGANLLLTFTNVRKNAFEPALQAALDMNQAMGGGEAGLQTTIIRIGKALQDPIKGFTALRRVGVNFSDAQQKQIKDLIKHNKLFEAQQLILKELNKEFGGSFKAAGNTAAGQFAKVGDAVEELQMALARALLPALVSVSKELSKFLSDPATVRRIEELGTSLAEGFKEAVGWVKSLDWGAIGGALNTAVGAAKAVIGAFAAAPPWLQQAIITGWGLNKLTGGMLTNIFGTLAGGLIKGVLGMNAGVVNINAGAVNGGLGAAGAAGGMAGKASGLLNIVSKVFVVGLAAEAAAMLAGPINQLGLDLHKSIFGDKSNPLTDFGAAWTDWRRNADWPFGQKNAPAWASLGGEAPGPTGGVAGRAGAAKSLVSDRDAQRDLKRELQYNAGETHRLNISVADLSNNTALLHRSNVALFRREKIALRGRNQIATLASGNKSDALLVADALAIKFSRSQAPFYQNAKNQTRALDGLKALQARFLAQGDTKSAARIARAIATVKGSTDRTTAAVKGIPAPSVKVTVPVSVSVRDAQKATSISIAYGKSYQGNEKGK